MRLIVFGATGGVGKQVVEQALAAGHTVSALARNPSAIAQTHERLTVIKGDVLELATYAAAMQGQDAVISALGIAAKAPTALFSAGISNIMDAMKSAHVRRLLAVSANGLDPGPLWQQIIAKPLLHYFFKYTYDDLARMEILIRQSDLDWTIARPPRLVDTPHTGQYQMAVNKHLTRGYKIARADVADYLVQHMMDVTAYCGTVEIAY